MSEDPPRNPGQPAEEESHSGFPRAVSTMTGHGSRGGMRRGHALFCVGLTRYRPYDSEFQTLLDIGGSSERVVEEGKDEETKK